MEKIKKILRKMLFPPAIPAVILALLGYFSVLAVAIFEINNPVFRYCSYIFSAYALTITIANFPRIISFFKLTLRKLYDSCLIRKIRSTKLGNRFFSDVRFRTEISLYCGLAINFLYIAVKLFSGIYYRSVWFFALGVYYILLAIMRFILLHKGKNSAVLTMKAELKRYRMCGIMLLIMNQALAGIVVFMVYQNKGFDYPGLLIYAMAAYSFYMIIVAVINLVKFRKHGSPLLSAAKVINLVAAMVSILSLETAMLAQFGEDDDLLFRKIMTGTTGGAVCTIVIGIAIFMIWKSTKRLKKGEFEDEQQHI